MIKATHITKSFSNGAFNYNRQARAKAAAALLQDPSVRLDAWHDTFLSMSADDAGCIYVDNGDQCKVVYLTKAGVAMARTMGIKEKD